MNKSEQINELAAALAAAQGEIKNATKDASNPFFKSQYADLASVREAVQVPFAKHGLAITQLLSNDAHGVTVETVLLHKSGQWLSGIVSIKPVKDDPQALGSAVTYARRYSLSAIAGIASEIDDDGEAAMGRDTKPVTKNKPAEKPVNVDALVNKIAKAHATEHKVGETWVISGRKVAEVQTPEGKQPRIKLVDDATTYILGKGEDAPKVGEELTADVTMKETKTGAVYNELSNLAPF